MVDSDYTFGTTTISCDKCSYEEEFDGMDNVPDFQGAIKSAKEGGWKMIYKSGDWEHYCSACAEKI